MRKAPGKEWVYAWLNRLAVPLKPTQHCKSTTWTSEVAQSCLTLCHPMDWSLPGSFTHGIFRTRVLEWVAISFSRGSAPPRDRAQVSCIAGRLFTVWATKCKKEKKHKTCPTTGPTMLRCLLHFNLFTWCLKKAYLYLSRRAQTLRLSLAWSGSPGKLHLWPSEHLSYTGILSWPESTWQFK